VRELIVNADDFGFTEDVNTGIVEAHRDGILTATTLMANGAAFEHAVLLAKENPGLDIGCHLVLVGGESVARKGYALPGSVAGMMAAVAAGLPVADEFKAQAERILAAGLRLTHLDTHKHTHLFPPVLTAVARLSEEYGIRWVRRPFDLPMTGGKPGWSLRWLRRRFERVLGRHGCRWTDHFAGFQMTGRFHTKELVALIESLPDGLTEFMCHPGHCGEPLRAARTRLKESRAKELEALTAAQVRHALDRAGIRLTNYRDRNPS
jgi:predicted glycoside hydrolase/deacetylase ChbG (UPF0249 family)